MELVNIIAQADNYIDVFRNSQIPLLFNIDTVTKKEEKIHQLYKNEDGLQEKLPLLILHCLQ